MTIERAEDALTIKSNQIGGAATLSLSILCFIGVINTFLYFSGYYGDGQIHLVFAHNLLDGFPLQFNRGEPNGGETSMGFMFVVAGIMSVVGELYTPLVVKLISIVMLWTIAVQAWRLGRLVGLTPGWAYGAGVATLLLPGSAFNATSGTENAWFGVCFLAWSEFAIRSGWFSVMPRVSLSRDILLAVAAGAILWLRPEILPVFAFAWLVRLGMELRSRGRLSSQMLVRPIISGIIVVAITLAYVALHWHWTGMMPYGAGEARRIFSAELDSIRVLNISINIKVIGLCLAYSGIGLPALAAIFLLITRRVPDDKVGVITYLSVEFICLILLYIFNVLPGFHFTRYTIFLWPIGIVLAAYGLSRLPDTLIADYVQRRHQEPVFRTIVAGVILLQLADLTGETFVRRGLYYQGPNVTFADMIKFGAPGEDRKAKSDSLLADLGNPTSFPVVVALGEVQLRYSLDGRFIVRSLDGVTDVSFLSYICHGYIDHDGYLIDNHVDYLLALPDYNRNRDDWSLQQLRKLSPGESVTRPGIRYVKIGGEIVKVERLVAKSTDRSVQPCRPELAQAPNTHPG